MDTLSSILSTLRLSSSIYFRSDFTAPWGMRAQASAFAQFHMVAAGSCQITIDGEDTVKLHQGDIAVLPHGSPHVISDESAANVIDGQSAVRSIRLGNSPFEGNEVCTTLICGHFEFDKYLDHPLIESLPSLVHITDLEHREQIWFETVYNLIINESMAGLAGSEVIMTRLAEVMFVHVFRTFINRNQHEVSYFRALNDKQLSQSLSKIHSEPSRPWSLENLAKEAGMSRTHFANRFRQLVGSTPMEYVTQWRMFKAKELLKQTQEPIIKVAERVGYASEAAFNRAFKRVANITPLVFRKSA